MKIFVPEIVLFPTILIFYGSALTIAIGWIFKNRRDIRFPQWLGIVAAVAVWPFSLVLVVMITIMDMSIDMDHK